MLRVTAATLTAALLAAAGLALGAGPAHAEVTAGHCATDTGVTLIVDFQELGGDTIVRCVEGVTPGSTGLEMFELAGLSVSGTIDDGPAFVCRINGRPDANETIAVEGQGEYREACVSTPSRLAFWGYWHAPNGGPWTFSGAGGGNREVTIGGYEGWSFSLNNSDTSNPAPRIAPSHAVATPSTEAPTPTPTPTPTPSPVEQATTAAPPPAAPATTRRPQPTATASAARPRPSTTPKPSAPPSPSPSPSAAPTSATPSPSTAPSVSPTPQATIPTMVAPSPSASAVPPAPPVQAEPADDVPMGTIIGLGTVAALCAAGGVVWWQRRGNG